jgi:hypothetical protein
LIIINQVVLIVNLIIGSFLLTVINASIHYLDELVQAGMTDIGIDLKSSGSSTFHGDELKDKDLAGDFRRAVSTLWIIPVFEH